MVLKPPTGIKITTDRGVSAVDMGALRGQRSTMAKVTNLTVQHNRLVYNRNVHFAFMY